MSRRDYDRLGAIYDGASALMNAGPNPGVQITNADVIEAILWDLRLVMTDRAPTAIAELCAKDARIPS